MMNKIQIILISVLSFVFSCQDYDKSFSVQKNGVELTLPGFVKEDELADDAFIEYANRFRNFYIVGIELDTKHGRDSLWLQTTSRISRHLKNVKLDSVQKANSIRTDISGNFEGEKEPIHYYQKLIFNESNSYVLTIWTRGDERLKKYNSLISEILNSFKVQS